MAGLDTAEASGGARWPDSSGTCLHSTTMERWSSLLLCGLGSSPLRLGCGAAPEQQLAGAPVAAAAHEDDVGRSLWTLVWAAVNNHDASRHVGAVRGRARRCRCRRRPACVRPLIGHAGVPHAPFHEAAAAGATYTHAPACSHAHESTCARAHTHEHAPTLMHPDTRTHANARARGRECANRIARPAGRGAGGNAIRPSQEEQTMAKEA